jgi:hypothetical protein
LIKGSIILNVAPSNPIINVGISLEFDTVSKLF